MTRPTDSSSQQQLQQQAVHSYISILMLCGNFQDIVCLLVCLSQSGVVSYAGCHHDRPTSPTMHVIQFIELLDIKPELLNLRRQLSEC